MSLYKYVMENKELAVHVPATELTRNFQQVRQFIDEQKRVILKPIGLSRGRGICIIRVLGNGYRVDDYRPRIPMEIILEDSRDLERFFDRNRMFFNNYLIQRYLPLAQIDKSRFDVRVVMQKNSDFEWINSGIECRVAGSEILVTNISRGGYALTIEEALKRAFPVNTDYNLLKKQVDDLCHKLCLYLDQMGHHFAELGIDIAIDKNKRLWIIEANVFPSFKGFKKMDYRTYLGIRYTPMLYAASLSGFKPELPKGGGLDV